MHVLLVPENADMVLKRINKRNTDTESVLSRKYENVEFQQKLLNVVHDFDKISHFFNGGCTIQINIKENDLKSEVNSKIVSKLKEWFE